MSHEMWTPALAEKYGGRIANKDKDWRMRDDLLKTILETHACTSGELAFLFPSRKVALRRLNILVKRKVIKVAGMVMMSGLGRPAYVYYRGSKPKIDCLEHEVWLSRFCLEYMDAEFIRGYDVDPVIRPDAEMQVGDSVMYVEMDMGTVDYTKMMKRFKKYESFDGQILWICPSETRMNGLMRRAERINDRSLYTTTEAVLLDPRGHVWVDSEGKRFALQTT